VVKLDHEPLAEARDAAGALAPASPAETADVRPRAAAEDDASPGTWALVVLLAVATFGVWLGRTIIVTAPDAAPFMARDRATLELWAGLEGLLCGYGLAALIAMAYWTRQVLKAFRPAVPRWGLARWLLVTFLTLAATWLATADIPAGSVNGTPVHPFSGEIAGLTIAGGVVAIPGLVGFLALRSLARKDDQWDQDPRRQALTVLRLRTHLRRLLGTFGLFLTLYVVTTAARRQLILSFYPGVTYPQDYPVLVGLVAAATLGLLHVTATMAINWRCDRLLDQYAPVPDLRAEDISAPLQRRRDLAAFLGADSSWQETFQSGLVVLAPLLTALIGTALPK